MNRVGCDPEEIDVEMQFPDWETVVETYTTGSGTVSIPTGDLFASYGDCIDFGALNLMCEKFGLDKVEAQRIYNNEDAKKLVKLLNRSGKVKAKYHEEGEYASEEEIEISK